METNKSIEYTLSAKRHDFEQVQITDSDKAQEYARKFYYDDISIYESVFLIMLNQMGYTIGWAKIAQGGISGATVDIRLVAKFAIDSLASSVILVHNHPSGIMKPSRPDISITEDLRKGLNLLNIELRDSIILSPEPGEYYSMADNGNI